MIVVKYKKFIFIKENIQSHGKKLGWKITFVSGLEFVDSKIVNLSLVDATEQKFLKYKLIVKNHIKIILL